jgi:serine phosphatase RsbU (regulator of sigma subunit)
LFRFGTVWSLPLVYAVLLLLSGLGAGISPSLQGLVDLAGIASICLIIPWLLRSRIAGSNKRWLVIAAVAVLVVIQPLLPGTALPSFSPIVRHLLVFIYALCAGIAVWVVFQTAARGKRGPWWLRSIFVSGVYLCLVLFVVTPQIWLVFTIPGTLILLNFRPLKSYQPWKLALIMIGTVVLFFSFITESAWSGNQMVALAPNALGMVSTGTVARNLLDSAKYFLATVSAMLALRVALHGILGIYSPHIRVRSKLTLTVLFSSVIPGILMLIIVLTGVYVVAGGYCASLVKSMMMERTDDLYTWLDTVDNPSLYLPTKGTRGAGVPEKATLDIFQVVNSDSSNITLRQFSSDHNSVLGDSLQLPGLAAESHSGFLLAGEQLESFALHIYGDTAAVVHSPLNQNMLDDIKSIVGVDIELYRPSLPSIDSTVSISIERARGRHHITSYGPTLLDGGDTLQFAFPSELSTQIESGDKWYEKSFYFGMNYLPVVDIHKWNDNEPMQYVMVVRTSLRAMHNMIFARTNMMNRVAIRVFFVMAMIFLLTLLFIWVTGIVVARGISSGAAKLVKGTQRLRQGDLGVRIPLSSKDELGEVANSFNLMASDLKRMMEDMAEKERMEKELAIARSIQLKLLPKEIPQIPGIDVYGVSEPAREVGGDCYDILMTTDENLALSIGDVSGKGMAAALLMANLQASLRMLSIDKITPRGAIRRLNESICQNIAPGMFITYFLGLWDNKKQKLHYVNAGHDYPLIARGDKFESLETGGMVLGVDPAIEYVEGTVKLDPGDWMFLYSDGLIDVRDEGGKELDIQVLQELFRKYAHLSAKELVYAVMNDIYQFSKDPIYDDDRTLVAFHVLEEAKAI